MWRNQTIHECCSILDNQRIPLNADQRFEIPGNYPYYGANGVQGHIGKYIFEDTLILMAEDGGYFDEFDKRPIAYQVSGKFWVNNHAHILKAKEGFDQDYIFYSLVHKNIMPFIKGGTRSKLNQSELKEIVLSIPTDENIQRKVSKILVTADEAIEKTESLIAKYEQIKQGMMQDLFTRGVDEHGHLRPSHGEAPHLYKKTELGWLPKDWEVKPLGSLAIKVTDGDHHTPIRQSSGIYLLSARNVTNGKILLSDVDFVGEVEYQRMIKRCHPESGDVLISCSGSVGRVSLVPEGLKCVLVRSAALVKPDRVKLLPHFAEWALRSDELQKQIKDSQFQAAQPNLFQGAIKRLNIPLPPSNEQKTISERLNLIQSKEDTENDFVDKLRQQKAGLMQDLLTGKVPVKVAAEEQAA